MSNRPVKDIHNLAVRHIKTGRLKSILYIIAVLSIVIPMLIVVITDNGFSSFYAKLCVGTSFTLLILGLILAVYEEFRKSQFINWSKIGIIIGLLIALTRGMIK